MHFEAVALEDNLGACSMCDSLEDGLHLSGIETRLRHKYIETEWQQPERCDIELTCLHSQSLESRIIADATHQCHYRPDSTLDVDTMISEDGDQASLGADRGDLKIGGIVAHDRTDIVKPLGEEPIEFAREHHRIPRDDQVVLKRVSEYFRQRSGLD